MQVDSRPLVAIGGVGGSGTRLIAEILARLGYYIGSDLNDQNDNLWFTLLFKRSDILQATRQEFNAYLGLFLRRMDGMMNFTQQEKRDLQRLAMTDRLQHPSEWLADRVRSFLSPCSDNRTSSRWGWKEPNTHVVLDRLSASLPSLRYIHVARNGLDMAHSGNKNQLEFWGNTFLGLNAVPIDTRHSLKYWCRVHRRVLDIASDMPGRFLLLNYDEFCEHPDRGMIELIAFLGERLEPTKLNGLLRLVSPPPSIGRFRKHSLSRFDDDDVAYVASLGFAVH